MKLRILFFLSVMALSFAACKKDPVNAVTIEHEKAGDSLLSVNAKEALVLSPKISGKASTFQWLENEKEVGNTATYTFNKENPGEYTLVFKVVNAGGTSTLTYKIKVLGPYGNGVLILSNENENGSASDISYIDEKGVLIPNVFSKVNGSTTLSVGATEMYHFNNQYFISSQDGPNHVTVIDDQTLKVNYTITQTGISRVNNFSTVDGKTGYVVGVASRKRGLFTVDLTNKSISTTALTGTTEMPLIPINKVGNALLTSSGKQLIKVENKTVTVVNTYLENVSGVLKTADQSVWIGVQGYNNKARFIKLDQNFKEIETVELEDKYKLPASGVLTTSGKDNYIYWQEVATGAFCRFNVTTKKAETFIDPAKGLVVFASAWKVNPATGELYIIDSPGVFTGETESNLIIIDQNGNKKKEYQKVGYGVLDIVFAR